jgi:hypothetical protein
MDSKSNLVIHRSIGDTDPIVFQFSIDNDGVVSPVSTSANVVLNIRTSILVSKIGSHSGNGVVSFDMTDFDVENRNITPFEVVVTENGYHYVIASGRINYKIRI